MPSKALRASPHFDLAIHRCGIGLKKICDFCVVSRCFGISVFIFIIGPFNSSDTLWVVFQQRFNRSPAKTNNIRESKDTVGVRFHPFHSLWVGGVPTSPVLRAVFETRLVPTPVFHSLVTQDLGADRGCTDRSVVRVCFFSTTNSILLEKAAVSFRW